MILESGFKFKCDGFGCNTIKAITFKGRRDTREAEETTEESGWLVKHINIGLSCGGVPNIQVKHYCPECKEMMQ